LLASLVLFIVGCWVCAISTSIEMLIIGRFIQAVGGSGPIVLARSIVRDLYEGPRAGQELSRMGSIMGLVPAIAPSLGGLLQAYFNWQANFWTASLFGIMLVVLVYFALEESCSEEDRAQQPSFRLSSFFASFAPMMSHKAFWGYLGIVWGTYGGLFAFISGSSFLLQATYGLSEILFGFSFGLCALSYVIGAMIGSHFVLKKGSQFILRLGIGAMLMGSLFLIAAQVMALGTAIEVIAPMMLYMVGVGLTLPQAMAQAIMPFPKSAGAASSLVGFTQMSFAALVGILVGHKIDAGPWPLVSTIAICSLISLAAFWASRRARLAPA
jgi:DHA1 family bicyclomycin/chloramphenicol resistance-like MFS transporter